MKRSPNPLHPPKGMMFFKGQLKPIAEVEELARGAMAPVDRLIELKLAGAGERITKALDWAQGSPEATMPVHKRQIG